jgi:hypothetical protein
MKARELVDHIRSGPAKLDLQKPLRFRRRMRSNPCEFNEILQALLSSETIRDVTCWTQQHLGITEDEWVLLVKTLGSIRGIQHLKFYCTPGSRRFHPFQAIADAASNAQSLFKLAIFQDCEVIPRDASGLVALANTIQEHTALQEFDWFDASPLLEAARDLSVDPVLRALPSCLHLQKVVIMTKFASTDALKNLLQLRPAADLRLLLEMEQWLAVADEIRRGRCRVKTLTLVLVLPSSSEATKALKALATAIRMDRNLTYLDLQMQVGFSDEAGVALAEALTVNKTLCKIKLSDVNLSPFPTPNKLSMYAPAYEAFSAMLRINTSIILDLPSFEIAGTDERLRESRKQLLIEQRLNEVGRGRLLASRQTTREEWVDALDELNSANIDDSLAFQVSCLYSLLQSNPSVVCMPYALPK